MSCGWTSTAASCLAAIDCTVFTIAYASVGSEPFEIVSYDNDAVPEYASPWLWGDVYQYDFCPSCGWACGWTYSENHGGDVCLECGASERDYDQDEPY